jgi:hypothetical protein
VAVRFVDIGGIVTRSLVLCVYFVDRCIFEKYNIAKSDHIQIK